MFKTHCKPPFALGFLHFRFVPGEDSLVLVVKGTYRLQHGGRARPAEAPEPPTGDVTTGEEPLSSACRYASDLVPFKPRADAMLVGRVHTPEGRAIPQCSASFSVGTARLSLLVTGDRYWLDPAGGIASDPRPFTEMDLGYERAFGGPGFAANPAGKGVFDATAREAVQRPLPNVEDPRELVRRPQDRPAPAGFGPLSPHWAHRLSKWPRVADDWAERWPWPPDQIDHGYFNAAQPALQIDGYLRGDEVIVCENLHPSRRRYECALPGVRPRCFAIDVGGGGERFREVGLRLDTLWVDMESETLVLGWRGSAPVASDEFEEVTHVYVAEEPLDQPRAPVEQHRRHFEVARMQGEASKAPAAPATNDNDAPAPAPAAPAPPKSAPRPEKPFLTPLLRATLSKMGVPPEMTDALDRGDLEGAREMLRVQTGLGPSQLDAYLEETRQKLKDALAKQGHDPSLLDPRPPPAPKPKKEAPDRGPQPWSRARVEACLMADVPFAGEDLSGLDLSELDLRGRDLTGCILKASSLADARLDLALLSGANLSSALAERCSLRDAKLDEADLTGAALPDADLSGADLRGALLDDAVLTGAKLPSVKAAGAYLRRVDLSRADLTKADLRGAHLDGARLDGAVLREADLTGGSAEGMRGDAVDLRGAKLVGLNASEQSRLPRAKLAGCDAERSHWMGSQLESADFTACNLRGADLSRADLSDAKLAGADCVEADFTKTKLRRASFEGANLWAARLEKADLRRAVLRGANLYQAALREAQLEGADFEGAVTAGTLFDSPVRGWAR